MERFLGTLDNLLRYKEYCEETMEKVMGISFSQYSQIVKDRMDGLSLTNDEGFLGIGKYGRIDLSVLKFSPQEKKYCVNSQILKFCNCCGNCK